MLGASGTMCHYLNHFAPAKPFPHLESHTMRMIAALTLAITLSATAFAQGPPKPGPEHEWLKKREGTWDTTITAFGMVTKGSETFKMEVGDLWLVANFEADLGGGKKLSGKGLETYDIIKKKYVSLWLDSTTSGFVSMEGEYDKDKKTLTATGEGPGPGGKLTKYKTVTEFKDDDNMTMKMYLSGSKDADITFIYKRKK